MAASVAFWVLFAMASLPLVFASETAAFTNDNAVITTIKHGEKTKALSNRKLKEMNFEVSMSLSKEEDYPRFDPSPSSKAAIHSGPIEHGTPLMPYVTPRPTPPPPPYPKHG